MRKDGIRLKAATKHEQFLVPQQQKRRYVTNWDKQETSKMTKSGVFLTVDTRITSHSPTIVKTTESFIYVHTK